MATYSTIKGFTIQSLASDPKTSIASAGVWATGGNLPAAKYAAGSAGTQTANVLFGGASGPPANGNQIGTTEEYDGTSWTASNPLTTVRFALGGLGVLTAAMAVGGSVSPGSTPQTNVEDYDGTSWTAGTALTTARGEGIGTSGISTAALAFGGWNKPADTANTELWNGSTWTEKGNLNSARQALSGVGTNTATLAFGGGPVAVTGTESWDGTSWTDIANLNTARFWGGASGIQTAALYYAGYVSAVVDNTEYWDGTTWGVGTVVNTARYLVGGSPAGTNLSALLSGGSLPPSTNATEEWTLDTGAAISIVQEGQVWYNTTSTVLKGYGQQGTGAWASGTVLNTGRGMAGGVGLQTAAIVFGGTLGHPLPRVANVEKYDGTTWTEVNNLLALRDAMAAFGTQTAALGAGGEPGTTNACETWDGTCWSEVNNMQDTTAKRAGFGTISAGVAAGGTPGPGGQAPKSETWDGTCWADANDMNGGHMDAAAAGDSGTSGVVFGGEAPGTVKTTETWNGTCWTEVADLNTARYAQVGSGTETSALCAGGAGPEGETELWNGTSWTEVADLATAGQKGGGTFNSSLASLFAGGYNRPGTVTDAVEEWTVPDAIKTFTAS